MCTDPIAYLDNGVCFCPGEKIFNSYGYCVDRTPGCLTPTSGDYDSCVTCIYGFIKNDNNKCDCPTGLTINTDHYCSACNVPGCIRCYTENANICNECLPDLNLVNGLCECEDEGQFPS